jgi:hypothetical protein
MIDGMDHILMMIMMIKLIGMVVIMSKMMIALKMRKAMMKIKFDCDDTNIV